MSRYIFITGGVVSSLGKGLASAALGALLQARGYSVRLRKLDPYLNVDPGTMSPFEHGEVFVTDDGAETDLDLGHYERFTGVSALNSDSISSGRIYSTVLEKERRGDYLGKTIQVIPHVTDEIKNFLEIGDNEQDFMLCEIGGTVGDIEGLPFFEAIRQFSQEKFTKKCIFIHLTLIPFINASGELKTKPTQHSVKELRAIGITPDILVCRTELPIPDKEKDKLSLFCNVKKSSVISAPDLKSIYDAPISYNKERLDEAVLEAFGIESKKKLNLNIWKDVSDKFHNPDGKVKIAIIGKYIQLEDAYKSLAEALTHGGLYNHVAVEASWIDSESLEKDNRVEELKNFNAILVPGGFGERGTEGMILATKFAREEKIPFLGICLGMQMAVIELARNILNIKNAGSEEFTSENKNQQITPVIYHLKKWIKNKKIIKRSVQDNKGASMRLGEYPAELKEESKAHQIYKSKKIFERHRHRYEVDIKFKEKFKEKGILFSGLSPDGALPEIIEIEEHPWFLGVQFHPELKSKPFSPHPLFAEFIKAALKQSRLV